MTVSIDQAGLASPSSAEAQQSIAEETGPYAIEVKDLVKRYAKSSSPALDGVSFRVRAGEMFGLLGPNGAGKTTTMGILTTLLRPTAGKVLVAGWDVNSHPAAVKRNIAVVPQQPNPDGELNAYENLIFHAAYFGIPRNERRRRADELIELLGLKDWAKRKLNQFSGGMMQRVMIARALMTRPAVLFLDEPTSALDPQSRLFLWDTIAEVNRRGTTIVLTTHNMEEANSLCQRVGIIDHGKLLVLDTPSSLKRMVPGGSRLEVRVAPCEQAKLDDFLCALRHISAVERAELLDSSEKLQEAEEGVTVRLYTSAQDLSNTLFAAAQQADINVREFRVSQPSLENLFIFLTGRELRV